MPAREGEMGSILDSIGIFGVAMIGCVTMILVGVTWMVLLERDQRYWRSERDKNIQRRLERGEIDELGAKFLRGNR